MENLNSFDSILESFRKLGLERNPIDAQTWMAGAMKLNSLLEGEVETLIAMEREVALMRKELLVSGNNATYARMMIEASPEYSDVQRQKARIKHAEETIRLAKKNATLTSDLMRNSLA